MSVTYFNASRCSYVFLGIQNLVLRGKISRALHTVQQLHPKLLEDEMLLFQLKCRQFIEVLSGHDTLIPSSPGGEDAVMDTEHTITVEESNAGEYTGQCVVLSCLCSCSRCGSPS